MLPLRCVCAALAASMLAAGASQKFEIGGRDIWTDTGIEVKPGDTVKIEASGQLQYVNAKPCGPEGLPRGWTDLIRQLPLNEAGRGTLVGRFGDNAAARPFLVGTKAERTAPVGGHLFLGVNQTAIDQASGSYHVTVDLIAGKAPATQAEVRIVPISQEQLDSIPPRVQDAQANPGDRVNFIVVGSKDQVEAAFRAAGWVTVDRSKKDALFRGLLSSLSKEAYVTLPMSELQLFGRPQDYGYAQGDPVRVVAARHHFRLWKAPFTAGGQTVWAGAGTHDIGFDRDRRNNGITHKIDPDTDSEREYIGETLLQTGLVVRMDSMRPANTVEKASTAHGEEFHSDGNTRVIYLQPAAGGESNAFADLFCSVLAHNNPDGGEWGNCGQYFEGAAKTDVALAPLTAGYRVLIVPGFMSSCFADSPAFQEGQQALKQKYNITVSLLGVPNDPSPQNAKMVAKFLSDAAAQDSSKWIVVGYSKGAPDVMEALANTDAARYVAAFVSVAGAVGGSSIAGALPGAADRWINQYNLKGCQGNTAEGFKSLQKGARAAFLAANPRMPVPSYSIAAKSDREHTSKALLQTWQMLASHPAQDGQLVKEDAIVPESKMLGVALADHFAVALPFDKAADSTVRSGMDKTRYPRAALLEAIVRQVTGDLPAAPQK